MNTLPQLLDNMSSNERIGMWFRHDGYSAHNSKRIKILLHKKSPYLPIMEYDLDYALKPESPDDMKGRIREA